MSIFDDLREMESSQIMRLNLATELVKIYASQLSQIVPYANQKNVDVPEFVVDLAIATTDWFLKLWEETEKPEEEADLLKQCKSDRQDCQEEQEERPPILTSLDIF